MNRKIKSIICAVISIIMVAMMGITAFAANEVEPNDYISTATSISVNETVYGYITDSSDDDYYKFTINSDGYINIDVNKDYARSCSLYLYSYNGTDKKCLHEHYIYYESIKDSTCKIGLPKGTYYFLICESYEMNYNFKINFVSTNNWEKERNETVVTANNVPIGQTCYGSIMNDPVYNDDDWFKFTTTADGYVKVATTHDYGKSSTYFYLYTYDGTKKTELKKLYLSSSSEKATFECGYLKKGTYYLLVEGSINNHYSFKINLSTAKPSTTSTTTKPSTTNPPKTTKTTSNNVVTTNNNQIITTIPTSSNTNNNITDYVDNGDEFHEYNDIVYYIQNMNIYIYNYIGSDMVVYIPSDIDGVPVTAICDDAFAGTNADVIHVPSSVTNIGANAFGQNDGEQRTVFGEEGSEIMAYAEANDIATGIDGEYGDSDYNADYQEPADKSKVGTIVVIIAVIAAVVAIVALVIRKNKKDNN